MRILVINPPNVPFSSKGILVEPIDVLSTASFIAAQGHEVRLLDMDINRRLPDSLTADDCAHDAAIIICDYHIPLHNDGANAMVLAIAAKLQSAGIRVVVGGKTATYKPQQLLGPASAIDVVIRHEMEPALLALLSVPLQQWNEERFAQVPGITYRADSERLITTRSTSKPFDLDQLPIPDRRLVDLNAYIDLRTMLSSRGCALKCDFCHVPGFWGNWRARDAKLVVDEIELLASQHASRKILFLDDNMTLGRKRLREICHELIRRNVRVELGCLGSLSTFEDSTMELMYAAGFRWIHYGVESGADCQLAAIHKKVTADDVRRIVTRTRAIGFRVRTSWIMDLPGTTQDELKRTADMILELRTEEIRLHHLAIRLGSRFSEEYGGLPSTQYIHNGSQNHNLAAVSAEEIRMTSENIIRELTASDHTCVRHPDEFIDVDALRQRSEKLNIVSLCPLRYGLGWEV